MNQFPADPTHVKLVEGSLENQVPTRSTHRTGRHRRPGLSVKPRSIKNAMIEIEHLSKNYGRLKALDDLNLTVRSGEIYGFLGPNGAGKTTTIRIISGLIKPSSGTVRIRGFDILRFAGRGQVGHGCDSRPAFPV